MSQLSQESPVKDWEYFAEGAAHFVFKYCGSDHKYEGKLLRFRKYNQRNVCDYYRSFIGNFPELRDYIEIPIDIVISGEWLQRLLDSTKNFHDHSRKVWEIQNDKVSAHLITNHHRPSPTSIEIKPKWQGLLSIIPENANNTHGELCRFCKDNNIIYDGTQYCPFDLFSPSPTDFVRAIKNLTMEPRNNLQFYIAGNRVPDENLHMHTKVIIAQSEKVIPKQFLSMWMNLTKNAWMNILKSDSFDDQDILFAVALRDCSWVIGESKMHIIDLDKQTSVEKMRYYRAEVKYMKEIYNSKINKY